MHHVTHKVPEQRTSRQRNDDAPQMNGSHALAVAVTGYVLTIIAMLAVLGIFGPNSPTTATASSVAIFTPSE